MGRGLKQLRVITDVEVQEGLEAVFPDAKGIETTCFRSLGARLKSLQ